MLITLMFSVVAMTSKTFSTFSYSANEQVCRSWEGAQPASQPSWPVEMLCTTDIILSLQMGVGWGGCRNLSFSHFHEFESSVVQEFGLFGKFCKICKIHEFQVLQSLLRDWLQICHQAVRQLYCT